MEVIIDSSRVILFVTLVTRIKTSLASKHDHSLELIVSGDSPFIVTKCVVRVRGQWSRDV